MSGAMQQLRELAERAQIPVTLTLLGKGAMPENHPLTIGMMGMHGEAASNLRHSGSRSADRAGDAL